MRVLLTGGTGFIGGALLRELIQQGHHVSVISRKTATSATKVDWLPADITKPETLKAVVKDRFDLLIHAAGLVASGAEDREALFRVNRDGTRNVLETARQIEIPRVIAVSSVASIGPASNGEVVDESVPFRWNLEHFPYHASKYEGEQIALDYSTKGLSITVVNPAFVFGEGDDHTVALQILQKLRKRKIPLYPPGGYCYVWVGDVVAGILKAIEKGRSGERYVLGGENVPHSTAYPEMARAVGGVVPRFPFPKMALTLYAGAAELEGRLMKKTPRFTKEWARAARICHFYSSAKATRELEYRPIGFQEMILRTTKWMKANDLL